MDSTQICVWTWQSEREGFTDKATSELGLTGFFPGRYGDSRMRGHVSKGAKLLKKEGAASSPG